MSLLVIGPPIGFLVQCGSCEKLRQNLGKELSQKKPEMRL